VLENGAGRECIDAAKAHVLDRRLDRLVRGVVAIEKDQARAARRLIHRCGLWLLRPRDQLTPPLGSSSRLTALRKTSM
jgi:hypothetical protein